MRMRRTKNLEDRIDKLGKYFIKVNYGDQNASIIDRETVSYFDYEEIFQNKNDVHIEVGCGKGQFIYELAKTTPEINYFAIDKNPSVLAMACKLIAENNLTNVRCFNCGAEYLERYFKAASVGRIYLNFSCPFPKNSYENRRLTNKKYLDIYKKILSPCAEIHQKTDNMRFFEYSLEQFSENGFTLKNISLDLHKSCFSDNIITEYERRFSAMGMPIYRLEAYVKHNNK